MENHALIVEIEPCCLLAKAGVEVGDVLDELCGEHVLDSSHGKVRVGFSVTVILKDVCLYILLS